MRLSTLHASEYITWVHLLWSWIICQIRHCVTGPSGNQCASRGSCTDSDCRRIQLHQFVIAVLTIWSKPVHNLLGYIINIEGQSYSIEHDLNICFCQGTDCFVDFESHDSRLIQLFIIHRATGSRSGSFFRIKLGRYKVPTIDGNFETTIKIFKHDWLLNITSTDLYGRLYCVVSLRSFSS